MFRLISLPRTLNTPVPGNHHVTVNLSASSTSWIKSATSQQRSAYSNKHGEEIIFDGQYPPRGYILVPAGSPFITRRCRVLAQGANKKIYAYYLPSTKYEFARHKGLYVPKDIFKKVESDYSERKAVEKEKWLQKLDKAYPNMPSKDRAEICRLCSSQFLKPKIDQRDIAILHHVQDRYTALKGLSWDRQSMEVVAKARQEADKILSVWRGRD